MSEALLQIEDLHVGYIPEVPVLEGVELTVDSGEIVAIVGPNGAGKSTVLRAVMGLLHPWRGQIRLGGTEMIGMRVHDVVRSGISFVPQSEIVFPYMTVEENLEMAWFALNDTDIDKETRRREVYKLFPLLEDRLKQHAGSMSGGEQQMVALGRALMTSPRLLLLDEPSLGLSPRFLGILLDTLDELRQRGLGIGMVEQNAAMALDAADRGYVLDMGEVRFTGTGEELLASSDVRRLYVGGGATQ
ncbi:MAG: ATP-binding cassette domain-containing protein [Acidimicrobiia bacterium]|nr:ATP-binding cassette domain-containing protein [Acidimicrobiia bacterium]